MKKVKYTKRKKRNVKYLNIILLIIALTLICINIVLYINKNFKPKENTENQNNTITESTENRTKEDTELKKLQSMSENERMNYYCGKYINYVQEKKYEEAYDILYDEFKKTYFPTIQEYIDYVQEKYQYDLIAVEYNNIERNGDIYVLWVNIIDVINGDPTSEEKLQQNFVIREKNFNDFELSFSV